MGYSYGYGYSVWTEAKEVKEKLEKLGHEVIMEEDKINGIFWVRDFGLKKDG